MKFKKIDFVKILESSHKLSYKYKLHNTKLRKADKKDIKIVKEILNFFLSINKDYKVFGGEWEYLNKIKRKNYLKALLHADKKKLELIFSNLFKNDISYGIVTPSFKDIKNKDKFKSQILRDIDSTIEFSNLKYSEQISLNRNIGNPFGIVIKNEIIMPDTPRHFYFANKIKNYIKDKNNFRLLEIGGGYGGLARILLNFNKNVTYFSIDLLEGLFIQYYFLKKCGFKVNLIKKVRDIKKNQINLIIFDKELRILKKIGKCDFVFNSRSFSEMDKNILNKYIEVINKIIKPNYIYHENSNFLMFPKSKRHVEILGKDFKFNKKKYRLENFNISPFSGGSGRYREFFYKKI